MSKIRFVQLNQLYVPIVVDHGHLNGGERIDDEDKRVDILLIDIEIKYAFSKAEDKTLKNVFNYGDVYQALVSGNIREIKGPLEGVLDSVVLCIEESAKTQEVDLIEVEVKAIRKGLACGSPKLIVGKKYKDTSQVNRAEIIGLRSAGVMGEPLVVKVNHAWCTGSERVEHIDNRVEQVEISFDVETEAKELKDDLAGLYNYASLVHLIRDMHNIELNGPIEMLVDSLNEKLEEMTKKVGVVMLRSEIKVKRTGYARCIPVMGLINVVGGKK